MQLYAGIDLHSNNSVLAIINSEGRKVYQKRLENNLDTIQKALEPYKSNLFGTVVESTYNWYWLVDGLMERGYSLHLANPNAIKQYNGIKHTNDYTDANWLAELLRLNLLPEGYIYPKEGRGLRDLLRKRCNLVQQRTQNILSLQNSILRQTGIKISGSKIKTLTVKEIGEYFKDNNVKAAATSALNIINVLEKEVITIEKLALKQVKIKPEFSKLKTIPGVGDILTLTIMLETGDINRFKKVGNFSSYCRCVESEKVSNGKKKGENNKKNGNKYLSWAFMEAAHYAIRYNERIKKYYQKKISKTHQIVAIKTVAHKLARAAYYIMRNGEDFEINKAFV